MNLFPLDFICLDSETDGLKPSIIHMLGVQNLLSGEYKSFVGLNEVSECLFRMQEETTLVVGHNLNGYDIPVIKKLTTVDIPRNITIDTLDMSRDLCILKNHKLETWGNMLGFPKLKSPLFEHYSPLMDTYCERDVRLTTKMFFFMIYMWLHADHHERMRFNQSLLLDHIEMLISSPLYAESIG